MKAKTTKTKTLALITDSGKLTAFIDGIARRGKKWDADVQLAALSVISHLDKHGDVTLVNRLFLAMPGGARRASLAQWLMAFGKCNANTGDNKRDVPFVYAKDKTTDMAMAEQTTWHTMGAPEKAPDEVFDLLAAINRLLARAQSAEKVSDPAALARIEEIAKGMTAAAPRTDALDDDRKDDAPRQPQRTVVKKSDVQKPATTH